MTSFFELVKNQSERSEALFPDEKIVSTLYYCSLSRALRSIHQEIKNQDDLRAKNEWLSDQAEIVKSIPAINLDALVHEIDADKKSCDVLFYDGSDNEERLHLMGELKNTSKKEAFRFLKSNDKDGILLKIRDSYETLRYHVSFESGLNSSDDAEGLQGNIHFFFVYAGKNNMVSSKKPIELLPGLDRNVSKKNGRQIHASRQDYSQKQETEILSHFKNAIRKIGLVSCLISKFPGATYPDAERLISSGDKSRAFSVFSGRDFAEIINNGFFTDWKWGELSGVIQNDTQQSDIGY